MKTSTRTILTLLLSSSLIAVLSCTNERPLYPREDALADLLHEPFENREAEELALHLSGQIIAPESLYVRVDRDLASIRSGWSDSIPELQLRGFKFQYVPGEVVIYLHDELDALEWMQRTPELERIRSDYKFDSIAVAYNRITLRSRLLLNSSHLLKRLERLAGVCWAQLTPQGGASLGAFAESDTIYYMCQIKYGIRIGWVTIGDVVGWFKSDTGGVSFLGNVRDGGSDTISGALKFAMSRRASLYSSTLEDSIQFRDETPPARATDLKLISDQVGRTATIRFTSTGDDGIEGAAYRATVYHSTTPITDANLRSVSKQRSIDPGYSGDELTLTLTDLSSTATNYVAVQFVDCNQNASRVSNIAQSRNIWLNGWTFLNSENSPLPDDRIITMFKDSRERIWLGTRAGLACKDQESWTIYQTANSGVPSDIITSVTEGPDGAIWVGTPQGLGRFDGASWQSYITTNSSLPKQEIRCVEAASDGSVWIGYGNFGLVRYFDGAWTVYGGTTSESNGVTINAILSDSRGSIWVGTNFGVTRIEYGNWDGYDPINGLLRGQDITSIFEDADGRMWCGSSFHGVSWYDGSTWRSRQLGLFIKEFTLLENGPLWIAGTGGIWRHTGGEWLTLNPSMTALPSSKCTGILAEGAETLWIATADNGLCRWDLKAAKLNVATPVLHDTE